MSTREVSQATKAQTYFRRAEHGEDAAKQIRKKERAAAALKTANLRRLRLEKESADKQAADRLAAANGGQPANPARRSKAARKRAAVRMIY
jgi:hypothetical protein